MPKITCPKCGSAKTTLAYKHFVQGSYFQHRFFRCLSCLYTWDRDQELRVEKAMAKDLHKHYKAMPDT